MSGDEKAQQVGQVVTQFQQAKVDLAHLEQKLRKIGNTCSAVGRALSGESSSVDEYSVEILRYSSHLNINPSVELLTEESLLAVISERDKLKKLVSELLAQMRALGITNLQ